MSEFTLPANSKVGEGKHWALPQSTGRVKSFRIYRWDPSEERQPDDGHV
jgi:succinate dehydrogenase / fumarate reductase, iron-sulfur subunit